MKAYDIKAGHMYARTPRGYVQVGDAPVEPTCSVCRRLRDFDGHLPDDAVVTGCADCGCAIAFSPKSPYQHVKKVCMQCAGIEPLPLETADGR